MIAIEIGVVSKILQLDTALARSFFIVCTEKILVNTNLPFRVRAVLVTTAPSVNRL